MSQAIISRDTVSSTDGDISEINGSMHIKGNLGVDSQITANALKVISSDDQLPMFAASGSVISFKKSCEFKDNVKFNDGLTVIGKETTYNTAYVGSPTIQVGNRLIVGDSLFKITGDERSIIADTFTMSLYKLNSDYVVSKKDTTNLLEATNAQVTNDFVANKIYADTIKSNNLVLESVSGLDITASSNLTTKDLFVNGSAKIANDLTIVGTGTTGAALTINGGQLIANKGIISHTANNRFQTLEIMGSGTDHDVCFKVDKNVDSLIEGNVTIQDSKLILDNSYLYTDDIIVMALNNISSSNTTTNGVNITSKATWDTYEDSIVSEVEVDESFEETYDPYQAVEEAVERNATNYQSIEKTVKTILNPITYLNETNNTVIPKKFAVGNGLRRIDANGNMMMKNIVSEQGKFSSLSAFDLKVNQFQVDKLVTTSVASNVVDTDNLLRASGIAEFDGVVNSSADIFIEDGSSINVASGAGVTFQNGSSLTLKNGASFEMGSNTTMKMSGDVEIDIAKTVFVDSTTGCKYQINFVEGIDGLTMTYNKVEEEDSTTSTVARGIVRKTSRSVSDLNEKLKKLGL